MRQLQPVSWSKVSPKMNIVAHLEQNLGIIEQGWISKDNINRIQVVRFLDRPFDGAVTYATLGLSDFILSMPNCRGVRQELIFCGYNDAPSENIASFLASFCDYIMAKQQALLRGDVVGPSTKLLRGYQFDSIYASIPSIFDENLHVYDNTSPSTVIVWIIPLYQSEANFVKMAGWSKFEDLMESLNPDLLDLSRHSIVG